MIISPKENISQRAVENLLAAHKRVAASGSVKDLILLTRFLLKLGNKLSDVSIEVIPEDHQ